MEINTDVCIYAVFQVFQPLFITRYVMSIIRFECKLCESVYTISHVLLMGMEAAAYSTRHCCIHLNPVSQSEGDTYVGGGAACESTQPSKLWWASPQTHIRSHTHTHTHTCVHTYNVAMV